MDGVSQEMPRYQSHKKVWALKIKSVDFSGHLNPSATITPEDEGYGPFEVTREWVAKHDPEAGGYYVVYDDGYASWSPSEAFEQGYTKL
jgi:hypothetical protein